MRDARDDLLLRDRLYLPLEDAERCGLSEADLERIIRAGAPPPAAYRRLVRLQGRRAAALLSRAEEALPHVPLASAVMIGVLIDLHRSLNDEMRARGFDTVSREAERVRVPTLGKLGITARTAARVLLAPESRQRCAPRRGLLAS